MRPMVDASEDPSTYLGSKAPPRDSLVPEAPGALVMLRGRDALRVATKPLPEKTAPAVRHVHDTVG